MLNARTSLQERYATDHISIPGDTSAAHYQRFVAVPNPKMAAREKVCLSTPVLIIRVNINLVFSWESWAWTPRTTIFYQDPGHLSIRA
jgi:hypothetical protein